MDISVLIQFKAISLQLFKFNIIQRQSFQMRFVNTWFYKNQLLKSFSDEIAFNEALTIYDFHCTLFACSGNVSLSYLKFHANAKVWIVLCAQNISSAVKFCLSPFDQPMHVYPIWIGYSYNHVSASTYTRDVNYSKTNKTYSASFVIYYFITGYHNKVFFYIILHPSAI